MTLLARRGKLSSTTLRPFLHLVTQLDLSGASASLNLARAVARAPHLSTLAVRGRLCDGLAALLHAPALTALDCSCSPRLSAEGLRLLAAACPLLVSLCCAWCGALDSLDPAAALPELLCLDASSCPVREGLRWPPRLQRLLLGDCAALERAGGWPASLEQLELSRCSVLAALAHPFPPALRELAAAGVPAAAGLAVAAADCERLAWLDLSDSEAAAAPASCRAALQSLLLEGCTAVELHAMPQLTVLSLSRAALAGEQWGRFALLPALASLCLSHVAARDADVGLLLAACPALQRLDLSFCLLLTDAALEETARHGRGLLLLRLYGCPLLSLPALRRLAAAAPHLRLLAPTSE